MSGRTSATSGSATLTRRRGLLAGGAVLGLLGALSACTGEQEREDRERWASLGEQPERYDATSRTSPDPFTPEDRRGLECSLGQLLLTARGRRDSLEPVEIQEVLGEDELPQEGLAAPEGEQFLLCTLDVERILWELPEGVPLPRARFVVRRPGGEISVPVDPRKTTGTWIVRVVADPSPEDAVLEVVELGRTQRLSLVDGSLVHTDVPHIYGRSEVVGEPWPGGGAVLEGEQAPEASGQDSRDAHGNLDRITLQALAVKDVPLSRTLGWAADGEQYLRVMVNTWQHFSRPDSGASVLLPLDLSGSRLRLPDGTEREPALIADSRRQQDILHPTNMAVLWFSAPVDLTAAEVRISANPFPRREGLAEELAASCAMTIPLTLAPRS